MLLHQDLDRRGQRFQHDDGGSAFKSPQPRVGPCGGPQRKDRGAKIQRGPSQTLLVRQQGLQVDPHGHTDARDGRN